MGGALGLCSLLVAPINLGSQKKLPGHSRHADALRVGFRGSGPWGSAFLANTHASPSGILGHTLKIPAKHMIY